MSNKFLNPSGGETDLSDVIARVNTNTEAIQDHVADLANPHTTSTSNINPQPFTSDEVPEGKNNKYLVQPFVGNFDMGGNQILNASVVGNPVGDLALAGATSVIVLDSTAIPQLGIISQSGVGKSIETKADGSLLMEAINGEVKLDATNGKVRISSGGAFPNGGVVINNSNATAGVVLSDTTTGNVANVSAGGIDLINNAGVLSLQQNDATNLLELKTTTLNLNLDEANTKVNIVGGDLDMNTNNITTVGDIEMINDGGSEIKNVFRITGSTVNSLFLGGNTISSTANTGDCNFRCVNEAACIRFRVGLADIDKMFVCGTEIKSFVDLNMNQNLLQNVGAVINSSAPTGVSGTIASIGETTTNMSMAFTANTAAINQLATNIASFTPTLNTSFQDLSMDGNNITNVGNVALTSINTSVIYVADGTMPSSFVADRTYIFLGSRSTATPIALPAGAVTLKGMSRENSTIEYTGAGALFTSTDQNLTIVDLGWSCTSPSGYFLDAKNAAKDKLLTIQNCEFREAYQVMRLEGYDLVDFQNNVITYIRSGAFAPAYGMTCINVLKLEINSCEFIRWYEFGQPENTNAFVGNMIDISGSGGATQITNNIIHPRVAQNGIDIDAVATFGAGVNISGNTFVNAGLTSGVILETNSNADYDEKGITEANTLLPNLKARVGAQLSALNTATTATSGTPADINLNNLLVAFDEFGVTVGAGGGVTYDRTRPVNFQVTFVANLQAITGGANQRVGLTVSKNGLNTGINSFVNLDSAGTEPKSVTLTIIGSAVQGDVFRSQLVNTSTSSNITCTDLIVSGVEI